MSTSAAVVIGGGVIGAACAHYLCEGRLERHVIDRGRVRQGQLARQLRLRLPEPRPAAGRAGHGRQGLAALFQNNSPFAIKPRLDPALWSWLLHFARRCNKRDMLESAEAIQPLLESSLALYHELMTTENRSTANGRLAGCCSSTRPEGNGLLRRDRPASRPTRSTAPLNGYDGDDVLDLEPALKPGLAGGWHYHEDAHLRPDRLMHRGGRLWKRRA